MIVQCDICGNYIRGDKICAYVITPDDKIFCKSCLTQPSTVKQSKYAKQTLENVIKWFFRSQTGEKQCNDEEEEDYGRLN